MAMAAFIFRSLFRSSKTPSLLLSSMAFWTSGGGVMALMYRELRPSPNWEKSCSRALVRPSASSL
jgi:hypothetical protein